LRGREAWWERGEGAKGVSRWGGGRGERGGGGGEIEIDIIVFAF